MTILGSKQLLGWSKSHCVVLVWLLGENWRTEHTFLGCAQETAEGWMTSEGISKCTHIYCIFCTSVNCLLSTNYSVDMRKYQCVTMVSHVAIVTANKMASLRETRGGSAQETAECWIYIHCVCSDIKGL